MMSQSKVNKELPDMIPYGMLLTVSKHLMLFRLDGTKSDESMQPHYQRVSLQLTMISRFHRKLGVETKSVHL